MINTHHISCIKRNFLFVQLTWSARCLLSYVMTILEPIPVLLVYHCTTSYSNVGQLCSDVWPQSLGRHGKQTLGDDVDPTTLWLSRATRRGSCLHISLVRPMFSLQGGKRPWKRVCQITSSRVHFFSIILFSNFQIHETSNQQQVRTQRGCIGCLAKPRFGSFFWKFCLVDK